MMDGPKLKTFNVLSTNDHSNDSNAFSKSIPIITDGKSSSSTLSIMLRILFMFSPM